MNYNEHPQNTQAGTNPPSPRPPRQSGKKPIAAQILAPILGMLTIILAILLATVCLRNTYLQRQKEKAEMEAETAVAKLQDDLQQLQAHLDNDTILIEDFKDNAARYNVSAEFIQRFFDDVIIYKDQGIVYEPIDPNLPKNSYDWSFLTRQGSRYSYLPDNGPAAKLGIDVAKFQEEIDWEKVAAEGIRFAMVRMGYRGYGTGALMTDPNFQQNVEGALENGIDVGVYFFSQAINENEAIEEAEYLLDAIKGYNIKMPVVFDMEMIAESSTARANNLSPQQRTAITKAFCSRIKLAGYTPMIYGNPGWMLSKVNFEELTEYPLWLAQYYREPFFPYEFQMWQYTNTGRVNGINGNVDLNLCFTDQW
ncbi:MAG: hypothetical protein HFE45_04215 [Oscillospiraceae bacterium]|nr:hypothetical protein [Oscillospiraceae bacterium]